MLLRGTIFSVSVSRLCASKRAIRHSNGSLCSVPAGLRVMPAVGWASATSANAGILSVTTTLLAATSPVLRSLTTNVAGLPISTLCGPLASTLNCGLCPENSTSDSCAWLLLLCTSGLATGVDFTSGSGCKSWVTGGATSLRVLRASRGEGDSLASLGRDDTGCRARVGSGCGLSSSMVMGGDCLPGLYPGWAVRRLDPLLLLAGSPVGAGRRASVGVCSSEFAAADLVMDRAGVGVCETTGAGEAAGVGRGVAEGIVVCGGRPESGGRASLS